MKPATRFKLSALSACCVVALYGCGGGGGDGGGGDANPQSDQQTNNNRNNSNNANNGTTPDSTVEGTTLVADKIAQYGGTRTSHKVTLDDSGKAVAMWLDGGQSLMAAETGTDERWSAPQSVTATAWARFDIQTNRAGQRVALALEYPQGGTEPAPQVVFYRPETGWSARILAKGRLMDIAMPNDVGNASLTVLEDGSATFVTRENSSSGFSKFPFEALRVLQDGTQSVVLEGLGLDR